MSSFWWNSSEEQKKMHWVSWEKLCKSKKDGGLGFRDISDFNQALLAKQAWRLLSEPDSLLSRVYKARYFKRNSFLHATVGSRPSYAWRSVLHGRELLDRGLMKSIGDGKDTKVWLDKWIFDDEPRHPLQQQTFIDLSLTVANLITPQGSWNQSLISTLFLPQDVVRIMSFPPIMISKDKYIWAYNQNGVYSVKSGSWLLMKQRSMLNPEPVQNRELNVLKSQVWELRTLPKIKLFLWRALSGALAVSECLQNHGLHTQMQCGLCRQDNETISHVLFSCWPATKVWEIANLPQPSQGFSASLDSLVSDALSESALWLQLKDSQSEGVGPTTNRIRNGSRWIRPQAQSIKCNIHASWGNDLTMCGGAWIARDQFGDAIFHAREMFLPNSNRIAAELRCVVWALQGLVDIGLNKIEVWSDCNAAIEAIVDFRNWPRYHSFTTRIHRLARGFQKLSFHASAVKANRIAREIASSVTRDGRHQSYLARGGPAWLHSRIEEDKRLSCL